ncbi:MAG: phage receptor, partial [Pseudomonas sp.]
MNLRPPLKFATLLLSLYAVHGLAAPLSDFERFRSYPYMERSYREAKKNNWQEVERLTRHLLERVPDNDEARDLLIQALAHQRRYRDAEQLAAHATDADALLELRLSWIEQDPPAASQVESWIADSDLNQRIRLWQAYSLSLAKFGGAAKALDWLNQLPSKGDDNVLRLARANWAEQLHDSTQTIAALAPLAARGQLPPKDWQRLANAYVQRLDEAPLQQLLKNPPSAEIARQTRLAMANRAIAMDHDQLAQRWLQSLPAADLQHPQQRKQLWELARQGNDSALVRRLSNDLGRPCLETAEWLSRHDPDLARQQLGQCRSEDDPKAWLVLNQRLHGNSGDARTAQM